MSASASDAIDGGGFPAEFMDGESAVVRPVRVAVDLGGIRIALPERPAPLWWPFGGLRAERTADGLLHLSHPSAGEALLVAGDPKLAEMLAGRGVRGLGREHRRRLVAFYAAAVLLVLSTIYFSLPTISAAVARRIPISVEEKIFLQLSPLLARSRCSSAASDRALGQLVRRLEAARPTGYPVEVWIVDQGMVNAFALPGGRIVLTRGLLAKAAGPDEVAGVLAHEMAHVGERHVMTRLVRSSILTGLWAATMGDFSGLFVVDPSVAYDLATRGFSRDDERAADAWAIEALDGAGIPREGFAAFFERLRTESGDVPALLSTHPGHAERVDAIRAGGGKRLDRAPALDRGGWDALRAACGTPDQK